MGCPMVRITGTRRASRFHPASPRCPAGPPVRRVAGRSFLLDRGPVRRSAVVSHSMDPPASTLPARSKVRSLRALSASLRRRMITRTAAEPSPVAAARKSEKSKARVSVPAIGGEAAMVRPESGPFTGSSPRG